MTTHTTVSTQTAADIAGVTYRQLDYWVRTGHVTPAVNPSGSGNVRGFTLANVQMVARLGAVAKLFGSTADSPTANIEIARKLARRPTRWVHYRGTKVVCTIDFGDLEEQIERRWAEQWP